MAIFTAIGAAIFGAGTFAALATAAALQVAAGIAVSLIGQALAGQGQDKPGFGVQGSIQSGGDLPRSFALGYGATAGSIVYANYWGASGQTPNAYFTQVIAVSDYPVDSLSEVWVNGELCSLDATPHASYGYPVLEYRVSGKDYLWVKFYDGTQTTADSFLTGTVASTERPYGSTRVGTGCPYVIATSLVNEKLFTGFPQFKFALNGAKLYDVTKDTTAGGSGSHRWATPSTWGGDGDHLPAVQIYNILRGITYGGEWLYGLQSLSAARLPDADWIAVINKCRATITGPSGSEATYRSGGEIRVNAPIADAIESLLTTCQGRLSEIGGVYKLHVGAPGSSMFSFTDGDIISTEEQSFTPFLGLANTINGISATYPSPAEGWNSKVAPPLLRTDFETLDGARRLMADVPLDLVPYGGQVQRLMKSALEEARRARRHTFVLPPEAFILEPGDVVTWTSTRNGYTSKIFRVDGISDQANLDVMVDITEVDTADYAWVEATDGTVVTDGPLVRVTPAAQPMTGWAAIPATIYDATTTARRPSIEVSYAGELEDVRSVRVQVRLNGGTGIVFDGEHPYDVATVSPSVILYGTFLPNEAYEVRGIFVPLSDRATSWSAWVAVTTPNVLLGPLDVYGIDLAALSADVREYQSWIGQNLRETIERSQELATRSADQDLGSFAAMQTIRRELSVVNETQRAAYTEAITVAIGPGSAVASRLEILETSVNDTLSSAIDVLESSVVTIQGVATAQATAITALSAGTTGGDTNTANFRMSVLTGPTGYSRIGLETRQGGTGTWRGASIFLDTPNDPLAATRIVATADQFILTDGTNFESPFIFEGGVAKMTAAKIGTITSGMMTSPDGTSMIINLTVPEIYMEV